MFRRRRRRIYKTPSVPPTSQFTKYKRKKPLLGSLTKFILIIFLLSLFSIAGIGAGIVVSFLTHLPSLDPVLKYEHIEAWKFPTKLYSADGELIAEFAEEKRILVRLEEIPQMLKNAVIAVEDKHFYRHKGIDISGILRALWANIRSGRITQGGSTITQQLAKNIFLTPERTYRRKIQEILIAILIEQKLTKDEILERYFNKIYYGHGNYGVQAASLYYFDKHVKDLTLDEIAMLAGLPSSPGRYSPITHPERALARQFFVLKRMEEEGFITPEQRAEAKRAFVAKIGKFANKKFAKTRTTINKAPYFTEYIRQILEREYGSDALYSGGLNVTTTLDLKMQEFASEALWNGLNRLNQNKKQGEPRIEGALLAIDPRTGHIKAMVGGSGFTRLNQLNRAIYARRQPGSAFKPFIYTAAIDRGFTPATFLADTPRTYKGAKGELWEPKNYTNKFYGTVTLRTALEHSLNLATIDLLEKVGVNKVIEYARRMGINSNLCRDLSLALGTSEVTPLEMTTAFGVFANGGIKVEPTAIINIKDHQQNLLEERIPKEERVISPQTAYILTSLMEGVVRRGTAKPTVGNRISRVVAGKTGTTDGYVDAWFIGFTSELVVTVWIGYDQGQRTLGEGQAGGVVAGPIWADFMEKALPLLKSTDFTVPSGITFAIIDSTTGLLANKYCQYTRYEVFSDTNTPSEYCNCVGTKKDDEEEIEIEQEQEQEPFSNVSTEEMTNWQEFDKVRLEE